MAVVASLFTQRIVFFKKMQSFYSQKGENTMKFTRFQTDNEVSAGVLEGSSIKQIKGDIFSDWEYTGHVYETNEVKLLAPLEPNQIIGIGANFVSKADELPDSLPEIPVFFFKPASSVIGPDENIMIPEEIDSVKFESELAVVIGKEAKNVSEEDILDYVFGYTVGNDVTAPQYFHEAGHWTVGKSFDTFTPLGPVIETELDPFNINVEARLNEAEKQNSPASLMIVPIREMISYLTKVMTLKPGDVILTGSPIGAEMVGAGDVIECEIKGIGTLKNTFAAVGKGVGVS
jgi:2-keto-4-pentenoate hydratase/2-oxohepta-3-ene-1,7-dioic acid hydratase in catechol pathway